MNKLKFVFVIFTVSVVILSCEDPVCRFYAVNIIINSVPKKVRECYLRDTSNELFDAALTDWNRYQYTYRNYRRGHQIDYRNPDGELKAKLDRIMQGTVLNIEVHMKDGTRSKYTILYNNLNCVDTIGEGDKYHTIKITLDWKDLKPVENH